MSDPLGSSPGAPPGPPGAQCIRHDPDKLAVRITVFSKEVSFLIKFLDLDPASCSRPPINGISPIAPYRAEE